MQLLKYYSICNIFNTKVSQKPCLFVKPVAKAWWAQNEYGWNRIIHNLVGTFSPSNMQFPIRFFSGFSMVSSCAPLLWKNLTITQRNYCVQCVVLSLETHGFLIFFKMFLFDNWVFATNWSWCIVAYLLLKILKLAF